MSEEKPFIKRTLIANLFHMADVEIIIPFHGEQARVTKLMETIFNTVFTNRYLITLVDDHSPNRYFIESIKKAKIPGVRCLRLPEHKGFGAAINYALSHPWVFANNPKKQIPYVCIMHSDVYVETNDWLSQLGDALLRLREFDVKMVSPTTNNSMNENTVFIGSKIKKKNDIGDRILEEGYLPMYCALCNRELFNHVGIFNEYPYAGYEVQHFANKMKEKGFKQAVVGGSWVNHEGGATLANFANDRKVQKILRNAEEEFLSIGKEIIDNIEVAQIKEDEL